MLTYVLGLRGVIPSTATATYIIRSQTTLIKSTSAQVSGLHALFPKFISSLFLYTKYLLSHVSLEHIIMLKPALRLIKIKPHTHNLTSKKSFDSNCTNLCLFKVF
jgi:hypothetical protein